MKLKRLIVILVSLLCFIGLGVTLSKQQSQRADQILTHNGLSSPYYIFTTNKKKTIRTFIKYLEKNWPKSNLQVHFKTKKNPNRILIWSNYNLKSQPMAKGSSRYFNKSNFQGSISFAVISAQTQDNLIIAQGNRYLKEKNNYYSVLGQLKENTESPYAQTAYYLTTGVEQPTSKSELRHYDITIDGLPKKDKTRVQKYLAASVKTVDYAKSYNRQHGINPTKKFLFSTICIILALIDSAIWAILASSPLKNTHFKHSAFQRLLANSSIRFILIDTILMLIAYGVLPTLLFYSNYLQLFFLFTIVWILQLFTFGLTLYVNRQRKDKDG